jgi:hypothetical protein
MMAPFCILAMPSTLNVGDVPSSQPKVQVIVDPRIGPIVIGGEVHETQ